MPQQSAYQLRWHAPGQVFYLEQILLLETKKPTKFNFDSTKPKIVQSTYHNKLLNSRQQMLCGTICFHANKWAFILSWWGWHNTSAKLREHTLCTGSFIKYRQSTAYISGQVKCYSEKMSLRKKSKQFFYTCRISSLLTQQNFN